MDRCLVSVVVPVFHVEQQVFLNCVRSLLGQTEKCLEIILVFDGTKELYQEILKNPLFEDERLKLVEIAHGGVSKARNEGILLAKGEWIFFADADDYVMEDGIEKLLLGASRGADLVVGDYFIKRLGKLAEHSYKNEVLWIFEDGKPGFLEEILNPQTGLGFCWGKLFRRECLLTHQLWFEESLQMAEDAEFMLRFAIEARGIHYLPYAMYVYQVTPDSAVRGFRKGYAQQYEKAMNCIHCTIEKSRYGGMLEKAFATCVLYHLLLITVNYSFHPEQKKARKQLISDYRELVRRPLFAEALQKGKAGRFTLTRRISVWMIRLHLWNGVYWIAEFRNRQRKG